MKSRFTISAVFLMLLVQLSNAQEYAFKVLANKGNNEVRSGGGVQPVKVGARLTKSDELVVAANSYVGLVSATGKALEIREAGSHKIEALSQKLSAGSSVINKYTDFILSSNSTPKSSLKATGAVHRGPDNIDVFLPTGSVLSTVYTPLVYVSWGNDVAGPYTVIFSNTFGDELRKIQTSENVVSVNIDDKEFQSENIISVKVISDSEKKESADHFNIRRASKADREKVKGILDEVAPYTAEETAINKLILAGMFESNNLIMDASSAYLQAMKLSPDVESYQEEYNEFLLRNGIIVTKPKE